MNREIVISCLPYLAGIGLSVLFLRLLVFLSGARLKLAHLRRLHGDETGAVQSLSFVVTLPLFIMVLMFIVQLSQLTIAKVVVEYSAFAAARSAIVWIPAATGSVDEQENRISTYQYVGTETAADVSYSVYEVQPGSDKFDRIFLAAATTCLPICPSRDVGTQRNNRGNRAANSLIRAYLAAAPASSSNTRIPTRIANKLAYALENTRMRIQVRHKDQEPPLVWHDIPPYTGEFAYNEIGWQDQLTVSVAHDFALLPGPGRLLARRLGSADGGSDANGRSAGNQVADRIRNINGVYVYTLTSTVRLTNEGEKPLLPVMFEPVVTDDNDDQTSTDTGKGNEYIYDRDFEYYERDVIDDQYIEGTGSGGGTGSDGR